jgi:hypothetical protein
VDHKAHYRHASLRERIVEHIFVGDALRDLWRQGITDVEVLRSEFDAYGYDLVMSRGSVVRHIQLKASTRKKPVRVAISRLRANYPQCEKPLVCDPSQRLEETVLRQSLVIWRTKRGSSRFSPCALTSISSTPST